MKNNNIGILLSINFQSDFKKTHWKLIGILTSSPSQRIRLFL